jgi:hypothetical protein
MPLRISAESLGLATLGSEELAHGGLTTRDHDDGWVRALVRQKRDRQRNQRVEQEGVDDAVAFAALRAELRREIMAIVAAYNDECGHEEVVVALHAGGRIGLAKHAYPAGYLDVVPDLVGLRFVVTVKLRKDLASPVTEREFEGGYVVRDGKPRAVWFDAELSVPEVVQRILMPFFDEI